MLTMASPNHFSLHSASIAAGAATTATATSPALSSDSAERGMPAVAVAAAAMNSVGDVAVPATMNAVADADERSTTATSQERVVTALVAAKDSTLRMLLSSDPPYCAAPNMTSNSSGNSTTTTSISRSTAQLHVNTSESSSTGPKANTAMSTFFAPSSAVGAAVIRYTGDQTAPLGPLPSAIPSHRRSSALLDNDYLGDTVLLTCASFTNNELPPSERRRHQSRPTDGNSREGADGLDKSSKLLRRSTSIRPTIPTTEPVSGKLKTSAPRRSMASSSSAAVRESAELSSSEFTCANCGKSLSSARSLLRHGSTCKGPMKRAGGSSNSRNYIGSAPEKQLRLMSGGEEAQDGPLAAMNSGQYAAASDALESGGDSNHDDSNSSALSKIDDVVDSVVEKLRKQNSAPNPQRSAQRPLEESNLDVKPRRQQDPVMAPLGASASGTPQQQLCQLLVTTADGISHAYRVQGMPGVYYSTLTTTPTTTTTTTSDAIRCRRQYPVVETQELQQAQHYHPPPVVDNDDDGAVTKAKKKKKNSNGGGPTVYRYLCPECQKPYSCRKNVKRHRVSTHHVPLEIAQTGAIERVRQIVGEEAKATMGTPHVGKPDGTQSTQGTHRSKLSSTPKQPLRPPPKYVPLPVPNVNTQQPNNRRSFSPPTVHQTMQRASTGGTYHMVRAEHAKLHQIPYAAPPHTTGQISTSSGSGSSAGTGNRPGMLSLQQMDCASGDPFSPPLSMPSCSAEQSAASSRFDNMLHTPNTAPATMCYSDFDFWDLEGLKSRIEKPLISRSRDDDLEISSIVEDLKRTEYATSPTTATATGSNQLQPAFINTISSNGLMEVGGGVSVLDYGHSAEMDFTFGSGGGSGESRSVLMGSPSLDDSQRTFYAQPENAYGYYGGDSSNLAYGNGASSFYQPPANGSEAVFRSLAYEEHASGGYRATPTLMDNVDHYRIEHGARRVSIGKSDDLIQPTETQHMNGLQGSATSGAGVEKKEKHSLLSLPHNAGTFPCPSCNRLLSTDYSLRRHMKICERLKEKAEAKKKGKRAAVASDVRRRRGVRAATTEDDDGGLPSSEGSLEVIPPDPDSTSMRFPLPNAVGHPSKKTSPTTTHGR